MSDRLRAIYERVTSWQRHTFPHQTADGLLAHMRKELKEIKDAPHDVEERADMAILAMGVLDRKGVDPALNHGAGDFLAWGQFSLKAFSTHLRGVIGELEFNPHRLMIRSVLERCTFGCPSLNSEEKFIDAISAKMDKNEARKWPSPAEQVPGEPVEHIRDRELQFDAVIAALMDEDKIGEAPSVEEILRARVAELEAQGRAWRADAERLLAIHQEIRTLVGAVPSEGVADAVRRLVVELNDRRNREGGR